MNKFFASQMKNFKKCLVTGGAGFIGSHLAERLLKEGYHVTVIDDLSEGKWENLPKHPNLIKYEGSILGDISRLVAGKEIIFHLAAIPRVQRSIKYPKQTHDVNVTGTLNLLLAARDTGVKKFIFSSSSSVYGEQDRLPFTEDAKPNPISPYALQKLMAEQYCQLFTKLWGLETIVLRYFNVYGPRMSADGPYANLIPKFIKLISEDKTPTINGDGKQTRDFTYVSDCVEATLLASESHFSGEVFNIGFGKSISVMEVVSMINRLMGKNIKPVHGPALIEPKATLSSSLKAKRNLGWKPKVNLETGLKMMI